jgi:hypothetical protein
MNKEFDEESALLGSGSPIEDSIIISETYPKLKFGLVAVIHHPII